MTAARLGTGRHGSAVFVTSVGLGTTAAVLTELLSPFALLTRPALALGWAAAIATAAVVWRLIRVAPVPTGAARRPPDLAPVRYSHAERLMLTWVAVTVAITLLGALFAVPKTWDSLTYHLARVAHWAQKGSVSFYPTHILRQIYQPPWAEYAILHLYVLADGDRLVNLVQWAASVGCVFGVAVVVRQLGGGPRAQIVAMFVCATIPMGILQSSTTQNDYVEAFWLLSLAYWLVEAARRRDGLPVWLSGAALGLALLTKGTAAIYAAPFLVLFAARELSRSMLVATVRTGMIVVVAIAIYAPHGARNVALFGSPLGPGGEGEITYVNRSFSPAAVVSNVVRNVALHLGTPWSSVNRATEGGVQFLHRMMRISPEDPRITWPVGRAAVSPPVVSEDLAGSGLHVILLGSAVALGLRRLQRRGLPGWASAHVLSVLAGFLLFCVLLRWQPWHSRLHLPLLVLGTPAVALMLERWRPAWTAVVALLLWAASLPFLLANPRTPLTGATSLFRQPRTDQRIAHIRVARPEYLGAAAFVEQSGCAHVGLDIDGDDPEYLLWWLLRSGSVPRRIEHVFVSNVSRRLSGRAAPAPCVMLVSAAGTVDGAVVAGRALPVKWSSGALRAILPAPTDEQRNGPAPTVATVAVTVSHREVRPGQRLAVGLRVETPAAGAAAEVHLAVVRPDGRSAFLVNGASLRGPLPLRGRWEAPPALVVAPGLTLQDDSFVDIVVPARGVMAPGRYEVQAALLRRGSLDDGRLEAADILATQHTEFAVVQ